MGRIDTHTHVVPPRYAEWLRADLDYRGPLPEWSRDRAIEAFAALDVDLGVLSISNPGIPVGPANERRRAMARAANEFCAAIVAADPDRFGFFATLLLPDLDGSLVEAAYALDQLEADGVVLLTRAEEIYLGDPRWDPLLELLSDRAAVALVHPTTLPSPPPAGVSPGVVDFLAETARAAACLVGHDCLARFPGLEVILPHGGGYVPYAAARIAATVSVEMEEDYALAQLRKFWFDCAVTGGPYALPSLLAFAGPERLTFGSDWPFELRPGQARAFTERLDAYPLTPVEAVAMNSENAERLLPRLALRRQASKAFPKPRKASV